MSNGIAGTPATCAQPVSGLATQVPQYPVFFSDVSPAGPNAAEVNRVLTALSIPTVPPSPTVSNVGFNGTKTGTITYLGTGNFYVQYY